MSIAAQIIEGEYRTNLGKGSARELRRNKKVPAIIYGKNKENVNITLDAKEMTVRMHKSGFMAQLLNIKVGKETYLALPYEVQLHPVSDSIEHIDFIHVDEKSEVKVHVKIHYTNQDKTIGIKRGGVLNIVRREIELVCKAQNIPHFIEFDLSTLDIGSSIHINDIDLPAGTRFAGTENVTLVTIVGRVDDAENPAAQSQQ
ncbi:MAG: 50S ribosomal protein L25/general stress protein Ctc [Sphingobacteriia bacterium]|nr:50S ribosomal protein L25/general stress protein Ctc [Sphingobacteriia bacterium]